MFGENDKAAFDALPDLCETESADFKRKVALLNELQKHRDAERKRIKEGIEKIKK